MFGIDVPVEAIEELDGPRPGVEGPGRSRIKVFSIAAQRFIPDSICIRYGEDGFRFRYSCYQLRRVLPARDLFIGEEEKFIADDGKTQPYAGLVIMKIISHFSQRSGFVFACYSGVAAKAIHRSG